ncbi:MAG TPA: NADH-quinone oxidoreductase subunit NuoB [Candidatus Angelobacter sp.]|nr:NADH-quinone oxidoreductase subunit NuoB [Candidatus Angelobacter sp.]
MIGDVVKRSLESPTVLISVADLLGDASGSRMPDVRAELLTETIARHVVDACPTSALTMEEHEAKISGRRHLLLNYGECIGCSRCVQISEGALLNTDKFSRCGVAKEGLIRRWDIQNRAEVMQEEPALSEAAKQIRSLLGRALNIRQVDAGSCNGCEAEITALTNPYYDLERFGIHFVASPKHADMLLVTGPVTRNMAHALKQAFDATPSPKLVVAVGACGCSGGIFCGSHAVVGPVDAVIPVDGYIPGCPPTPAMLLTGILRVLRGH